MINIKRNKIVLSSILISFIVVIVAIFFAKGYVHKLRADDSTVIYVNGEAISVQEFKNYMNYYHVATTCNYFQNKYNAVYDKSFWSNIYGNEIPINYVREKTLQDVIKIKMQQILFREYGLEDGISYTEFLENFKKENKRRKEATKKGQAIYGPVEYGEMDYFNYRNSNNLIKLKEEMAKGIFNISNDELMKLYKEIKNDFFIKPDFIKIQKIIVTFADDDKDEAHKKIREAYSKFKDGAAFEDIAKEYNKSGKIEEQVFDEASARHDDSLYSEVKSNSETLEVGSISQIIELTNEYMIIKCTAKEQDRYFSFNESYSTIRNKYIDKKFEEILYKMIKQANVEINDTILKTIYP